MFTIFLDKDLDEDAEPLLPTAFEPLSFEDPSTTLGAALESEVVEEVIWIRGVGAVR